MFRRSARTAADKPTPETGAPPSPTDSADTVTWWEPTHDPALAEIIASARAHAARDLPDVISEPDTLIPEFDELIALVHQRLRSLQSQAQNQVQSDVELVAATLQDQAAARSGDDFGSSASLNSGSVSDDAAAVARSARAHARVAAAGERIRSASEALQIGIAAHVAYGQEAVARLDATVRTHHRHPTWLTYTVPTVIAPIGVEEIGLARLGVHNEQDEDDSETLGPAAPRGELRARALPPAG